MRLVGITCVGCAFLVFLGCGIGSTIVAPGNALVFAPSMQKVYFAPACLHQEERNLIPQLTIGQARILKLEKLEGPVPIILRHLTHKRHRTLNGVI